MFLFLNNYKDIDEGIVKEDKVIFFVEYFVFIELFVELVFFFF